MIISGDRSRLAEKRRIDSASIPKEGCILPEVDILQLFYLTAGSSPVSFVGDPALLGSSAFRFNLERRWRVNPELLLVGPKIGECRYGKVHEGKYLEHPVAIKVITEGKTPEEIARREARFNREVSLLSRFQHKNIVKFLGACKRPVMVIVTELLCGGSLRKHLMSLRPKRLDLRIALSYALDIAKAMECLHMNGIIHRDLKPENILLTSDLGSLKLADFGLAREETLEMMTSETGTYRWMAPELYSTVTLRHGEKKHYNHKVDVYSFSILLWELLTNRMPFEGMSNLQAAYAAAFKGARPTVGESLNVPEKIVSILKSCWAEDPNIRPNFSQIVGMIESYLSTFPENKKTMWSLEEKQESAKEVSDSNLLNKPRLGFSSCFGQCSSGR